ncbi:MAG: ComF family protein [Acidimicrobiia bacterium]
MPPPLAALHAALAYEGAARELVARLKYRNERESLAWLGAAMAEQIRTDAHGGAVVTWAPTTAPRRRERGFDHAEALAAAVAADLRLSLVSALGRLPGPPQTGLPPSERRSNRGRFTALGPVSGDVILVDAVVTTGTTLAAAAEVLLAAGASSVIGLVAAATPLKRRSD